MWIVVILLMLVACGGLKITFRSPSDSEVIIPQGIPFQMFRNGKRTGEGLTPSQMAVAAKFWQSRGDVWMFDHGDMTFAFRKQDLRRA